MELVQESLPPRTITILLLAVFSVIPVIVPPLVTVAAFPVSELNAEDLTRVGAALIKGDKKIGYRYQFGVSQPPLDVAISLFW